MLAALAALNEDKIAIAGHGVEILTEQLQDSASEVREAACKCLNVTSESRESARTMVVNAAQPIQVTT